MKKVIRRMKACSRKGLSTRANKPTKVLRRITPKKLNALTREAIELGRKF